MARRAFLGVAALLVALYVSGCGAPGGGDEPGGGQSTTGSASPTGSGSGGNGGNGGNGGSEGGGGGGGGGEVAETTASNTRPGARTTRRSPVSTPRSPSPPARTCAARRWPTRRRAASSGSSPRPCAAPSATAPVGGHIVSSLAAGCGEQYQDCLNAELAAMIERALRWYADGPPAGGRLRRELGGLALPGPHLRRGGASR